MPASSPIGATLEARARSATENAPHLVFIGAGDNLFLQNDSNGIMDQHFGRAPFDDSIVNVWRSAIIERNNTLAAGNTRYCFLIGPDKQSVFWKQIGGEQEDTRNSLRIFNDSLGDVMWVDPTQDLQEAATTGQVYPLTDSHWDSRGAYVAYLALRRKLGDTLLLLEEGKDFRYEALSLAGDLGNKFSPHRKSEHLRSRFLIPPSRLIWRNGVPDNGSISIRYKAQNEGTAVIFTDSFGQRLVDFLAESFRYTIHVHGTHFDSNIVDAVKPSLVISEVTERFMSLPPILDDGVPSEMLFLRKAGSRRLKAEDLLLHRRPLDRGAVGPELQALIARQEALADLLLSDSPSPTEAQARFLDAAPQAASPGDILVALALSRRFGTTLDPVLSCAYQALPEALRAQFEKAPPPP